MATNVTYTSLFNDITVYLERGGSAQTDPTVYAQIPRLINAAERDLANFLKLQGQIEVLVSTPPHGGFQQGNAVITKPDRWRQTVSMNYGTGVGNQTKTPLYPRGYEYASAYWPNRSSYNSANPPLFYADFDLKHWLISPTPDAAYPYEVEAYMLPPLLDQNNQSNYWTIYAPQLLLFTALVNAESFLKDDPRISTWKAMQQEQLQALDSQDLAKIMDRAAKRDKP